MTEQLPDDPRETDCEHTVGAADHLPSAGICQECQHIVWVCSGCGKWVNRVNRYHRPEALCDYLCAKCLANRHMRRDRQAGDMVMRTEIPPLTVEEMD